MPEQFRDGGQGELLASYMSGTFSEDAARKLCFEQDNQIRVLKQEVEYRKKRDEKLTAVAADLTGKLAHAEIDIATAVQSEREAFERIVDEAIDDIGLKREVLSRLRERDK